MMTRALNRNAREKRTRGEEAIARRWGMERKKEGEKEEEEEGKWVMDWRESETKRDGRRAGAALSGRWRGGFGVGGAVCWCWCWC